MDKIGFRMMLDSHKLSVEQIEASLSIAERFEDFLMFPIRTPTAETAWEFSKILIEEGANTEGNYISLIRYCRFIRNDEMFVALLELVDGGEVGGNLYHMVEQKFGSELRDEIFAGIGVPPYGTPTPDKPVMLQPVIERLQTRIGDAACKEFLSASLRDLPDEYFLHEREKFRKVNDFDGYLIQRKEAFLSELDKCLQEKKLFFAQEVTQEVIDFVRNDPEMGGGRREGNIIYETKIPYMAKQYLAEFDPILKRYYACHCPWVREAIKNGDVKLVENFCYCSGGFHKKPFEVIFERPLKVEVLESIIRGDIRCRFAIHLPT
jgi:hypothetical protein